MVVVVKEVLRNLGKSFFVVVITWKMTKNQNDTENTPEQGDLEILHLSDILNVTAYSVMAIGKWGESLLSFLMTKYQLKWKH